MGDTFDKILLELERCLMGTTRRQFTDEFKREAAGLLASSGRPLRQIAGELGIAPSRPSPHAPMMPNRAGASNGIAKSSKGNPA